MITLNQKIDIIFFRILALAFAIGHFILAILNLLYYFSLISGSTKSNFDSLISEMYCLVFIGCIVWTFCYSFYKKKTHSIIFSVEKKYRYKINMNNFKLFSECYILVFIYMFLTFVFIIPVFNLLGISLEIARIIQIITSLILFILVVIYTLFMFFIYPYLQITRSFKRNE